MDAPMASALAKLTATEVPVSIPKNKYQLVQVVQELHRLESALRDGEPVLVRRSLPSWVPAWLRPKARVIDRSLAPELGQKRLDALRAKLAQESKAVIEGVLTPLTVAEQVEIDAYYHMIRFSVSTALEPQPTGAGEVARQKGIDLTTNLYYFAKRVQVALKRKDEAGVYHRALTVDQVRTLDPRILSEIWDQYSKAFELTEEELGK